MISCCPPTPGTSGAGKFFSKRSLAYVKQFRRNGIAKEQHLLLKGLTRNPLAGQSILEIGCGVGRLHLTLLDHGALSVVGIDMAEGMIDGARTLSREHHRELQTEYHVGDFVVMQNTLDMADVTIADKVVCCYADLPLLLSTSLSTTRRAYAISYPRSHLISSLLFRSMATIGRLMRCSFHPHWHDC